MAKLNQAPCPQCLAAGMAAAWPSPALRLICTAPLPDPIAPPFPFPPTHEA